MFLSFVARKSYGTSREIQTSEQHDVQEEDASKVANRDQKQSQWNVGFVWRVEKQGRGGTRAEVKL